MTDGTGSISTRWVILGVVVAVFAGACVWLAFWQLDRGRERAERNAVLAQRLESDPIPLDGLLVEGVPLADDDLIGWPVVVEGTYLADEQVLYRGRALDGQPGSWLVAPMRLVDGRHIAVNRGWVPLEVTDPNDVRVAAPTGTVSVAGITVPDTEPGRFSPDDPSGDADVLGVLDLERLGEQVGVDLGPVVIQQTGESSSPPTPLPLPDVDDPGPHTAYVVQWFGFAVVAVIGFFALVGRQLGRGPFARFRKTGATGTPVRP